MTASILTLPSYLQRPSYRELLRRFSVALGLAGRGNLRWGAASRSHGASAAAAGNGLLNNLVAYWPLNEAGGANNALDLHSNGLTLTQTGSPGSAVGKVYETARAYDYVAGVTKYHARAADDALLTMGDVDCTFSAWVRLDNKSDYRAILGKTTSWTSATQLEYALAYSDSVDRFVFFVTDGTSYAVAIANNFGSPSAGTWYFLLAWHDAVLDTLNISVNNGTGDAIAWANGCRDGTSRFSIGTALGYATGTEQMYGRIGPVAMWKSAPGGGGVLSEAQRNALWNSGNGLAYADFDYAGSEPWYLAGGINPTSCIAAYQPIGAANLAASYTNLANPGTYNAAPGTAPTWASATGWVFNGSTQYLTTGIVPVENGTWVVRFSSITNNGYLLGEAGNGSGVGVAAARGTTPAVRYWHGGGADYQDTLRPYLAVYSPSPTAAVIAMA